MKPGTKVRFLNDIDSYVSIKEGDIGFIVSENQGPWDYAVLVNDVTVGVQSSAIEEAKEDFGFSVINVGFPEGGI